MWLLVRSNTKRMGENMIFDSIKYIFRYFNIFNIRKYVQLVVIIFEYIRV